MSALAQMSHKIFKKIKNIDLLLYSKQGESGAFIAWDSID